MILDRIVNIEFPRDQYRPVVTKKKQIVLHHTVSPNDSIKGDIATWVRSKARIATAMIIGGDGTPYQLFSSKHWGYNLGVKKEVFKERKLPYNFLDDNVIGIEIDSAGPVFKKERGKYFDSYGHLVPTDEVIEYPDGYRGYSAYQKYTKEQIQTVKELLIFWRDRYGIPLDYNEDMWDVTDKALKGESGVWSHTSFRDDKSDCHPQPELIDMLKSLSK